VDLGSTADDARCVAGSAGRIDQNTTNAADDGVDGGGDVPWELMPGMQDTHPALVSGRGARVVVHSQDSMPHPTAEGYDVPAEFSVTIGVRARENVRVSQPHGNCTRDDYQSADHVTTSPRSDYRSASHRLPRVACPPRMDVAVSTSDLCAP